MRTTVAERACYTRRNSDESGRGIVPEYPPVSGRLSTSSDLRVGVHDPLIPLGRRSSSSEGIHDPLIPQTAPPVKERFSLRKTLRKLLPSSPTSGAKGQGLAAQPSVQDNMVRLGLISEPLPPGPSRRKTPPRRTGTVKLSGDAGSGHLSGKTTGPEASVSSVYSDKIAKRNAALGKQQQQQQKQSGGGLRKTRSQLSLAGSSRNSSMVSLRSLGRKQSKLDLGGERTGSEPPVPDIPSQYK